MHRNIIIVIGVFFGFGMSQPAAAQFLPTFVRGAFTLGNDLTASSPYALNDTFFLESNPGATKTIYLDFDGHRSFNNVWGHDIQFDPFDRDNNVNSFSNSELIEIQRQFQNVVEDFLPFDVNVTTRDPGYDALVRSNASDTRYGIRMVNTQNVAGSGAGGGGTAYVNSFNWIDDRDNVAFAFNKGSNAGGMTNSHEIGHTLGLSHDGLNSNAYHPGNGSGETSWGPLMGAPFNSNLTQWSKRDYVGATTTQDDLAIIIKSANGINYRTDTIGNTLATAGVLEMDSAGSIFAWNIIERNTDVDMFSIAVGTGRFLLNINPFQGRPNLDILAQLYNANGDLLVSSNPVDKVSSNFDLDLSAGNYFVSVEGTGRPGFYSDYGSLGFYTIQGYAASFAAVPEPASGIALAMLILGMFYRRQRN